MSSVADLDARIFSSEDPVDVQRTPLQLARGALRELEVAVMARDRSYVRLALERLQGVEAGICSYLEGAGVSPADVCAQARHIGHAIRERGKLWPGCQGGYYIGCSAQEAPQQRWFLETGQPHYLNYRKMVVACRGTASQCRAVEIAAIDQHLADRWCRNVARGGGGIARGCHAAFVYICLGFRQGNAPLLRR